MNPNRSISRACTNKVASPAQWSSQIGTAAKKKPVSRPDRSIYTSVPKEIHAELLARSIKSNVPMSRMLAEILTKWFDETNTTPKEHTDA